MSLNLFFVSSFRVKDFFFHSFLYRFSLGEVSIFHGSLRSLLSICEVRLSKEGKEGKDKRKGGKEVREA